MIYFKSRDGGGAAATEVLNLRQHCPKKPQEIGQQPLYFVRRSVCCGSAVARGSLPFPSPSLGVSSLDLGRSRKVSGPFSLVRPGNRLFRRRPIGAQFLD